MIQSPDGYAQHYSLRPDEDLSRLSLDMLSLVPEAREALRLEMERRGLTLRVIEVTEEPEKHMDGEPTRLRGVGGWLLLFCIVTTITAPLAHIADAAKTNDTVVGLIDVSFTILAFYTGLSVWRVRRQAFRWVRAYLITVVCLGIVTYILSLGQASDTVAELIATRLNSSQTIGSVIAAVMWWQYFKKSKRVNATFGRNL